MKIITITRGKKREKIKYKRKKTKEEMYGGSKDNNS